jgi:hypothetical protein
MSRPPDFRELVGEDGSPEELERLRRVHELLVRAGPPPELSPELERTPAPPPSAPVVALARRRPAAAFGVAAAAVLAALVIGYVVGARGHGFDTAFAVPMHGVPPVAAARAQLKVGELDAAGNWPVVFTVTGLPQLPSGGWYELYLTKRGKIKESCGTFIVEGGNVETSVRLNVPYNLRGYTGWVVTAHNPHYPRSGNRFLLRTEKV